MNEKDKSTEKKNDGDNDEIVITKISFSKRRIRLGLITTLGGYLLLLLGAKPSIFGTDRSPVIGFVQTSAFLVGLGIICIGGYIVLMSLWSKDYVSLTADFGLRLVTTGYVIAVFTGMADVFGIGSQPTSLGVPYFGPLQSKGVELGEAIIAIGLIMMIAPPQIGSKHKREDNNSKIDMLDD